jgi:hypothetical protein
VLPNAAFSIGDGLTNLIGTIATYGNMLQLTPLANPGVSSTGNVVNPVDVTLANLNTSYQGKLIRIAGVATDSTGVWGGTPTATKNYNITDPTGTGVLRTAYIDLDYIGTAIPTTAKTYVGVALEFNGVMQLVPRSLAEITESAPPAVPVDVAAVVTGNDIVLSWSVSANATSYIIKAADAPDGVFTQIGTSGTTGYTDSGAAASFGKKFYQVIAVQ